MKIGRLDLSYSDGKNGVKCWILTDRKKLRYYNSFTHAVRACLGLLVAKKSKQAAEVAGLLQAVESAQRAINKAVSALDEEKLRQELRQPAAASSGG